MSKKKAHILMILFDMLAILIFWMGYDIVSKIVTGITNSADSVEFNNRVGFLFVGVALPITHLVAVYEYFWPKVVERKIALFNYLFFVLIIVLFAIGFYISARVQTYVERAGYLRCPHADHQLTFSTGLVYTKDEAICYRMVAEKSKPRR